MCKATRYVPLVLGIRIVAGVSFSAGHFLKIKFTVYMLNFTQDLKTPKTSYNQ